MKFIHLCTIKEYSDSDVIVEIMLTQTKKIYKYKTSSFIEGKFLSRARRDKNNWKSFNYLKNNSEEEEK